MYLLLYFFATTKVEKLPLQMQLKKQFGPIIELGKEMKERKKVPISMPTPFKKSQWVRSHLKFTLSFTNF